MSSKKITHLVVDTSAFIRGASLQDLAENIMTIQEVIDEVTSKRQLRNLVVLPYNLRVKDVFTENIKFITEFSKKTGDYVSLSATDIKVMALTYQMEKELAGTDHLRTEPTTQRIIKVTGSGQKTKEADDNINDITEQLNSVDLKSEDSKNVHEGSSHISFAQTDPNQNADKNILIKSEDEDHKSDSDASSDDSDWITPSNIEDKKKEMNMAELFEDKTVDVACITTDFAMQNVLKQIGLNVTAVDGRLIRHLRTFIFRCTTCFRTTSLMTKVFCPKCGHQTLKKVAISIDEHGNQQIHINGRKPLTARGKRFSLPTPRGGQHFQYPVITEDQHLHQPKATRLAQKKNNPLDPDYICGFSPFTMRDVNSKSAVLGVRADKQDMKQWLKKTANEVRRKRK